MFYLEKVNVSLSGKQVLSNVELRLEQGLWTAVAGTSGAGKTTLLRLLCLMTHPCSGVVSYRGKPLADYPDPAALRRKIPMTFQEPILWGETVEDNFTWLFSFRSARGQAVPVGGKKEKILSCLECVGLGRSGVLERPVAGLSGGEKQRVAIARALCLDPEVLLLDEPTSALDIVTAERIFDNIRARYPELTVVVATHSPALVGSTDRQVLLRMGKIENLSRSLNLPQLKEFLEMDHG